MTENHLGRAEKYFIDRYLSTKGSTLPIEECIKRSEPVTSAGIGQRADVVNSSHPFAEELENLITKARETPGEMVSWLRPKTP